MSLRRVPIVPTLLVLLAVGVMVRLGFWQIDRLHQKEALLRDYNVASSSKAVLTLDPIMLSRPGIAYRRVSGNCRKIGDEQLVAGSDARGASGWAHVVRCWIPNFEGQTQFAVVIGWSTGLDKADWSGGPIQGVAVYGRKSGVVLPEKRGGSFGFVENADYFVVADPPLAGLQANAKPDPANIPNNHLAYAIQWFLFAATALVIYALALRKRLAAGPSGG